MSERDEMRRLIDVIEKGVVSASVEQNVEDMRLFSNTASFIANKLDSKLKQKGKSTNTKAVPSAAKPPIPKPNTAAAPSVSDTDGAQQSAMPRAASSSISSADYERVRSVQPQATLSSDSA